MSQRNALTANQLGTFLAPMSIRVVTKNIQVREFITDFHDSYLEDANYPRVFLEVIWNKDENDPSMAAFVIWMKAPEDGPDGSKRITRGWYFDMTHLSRDIIQLTGYTGASQGFSFRKLLKESRFHVFDIRNIVLAMGSCLGLIPLIEGDIQVLAEAMHSPNTLLVFNNSTGSNGIPMPDAFAPLISPSNTGTIQGSLTREQLQQIKEGDKVLLMPPFTQPSQYPLSDDVVYRHVFALSVYPSVIRRFTNFYVTKQRLDEINSIGRSRRDFAVVTLRGLDSSDPAATTGSSSQNP